MAFFLILKDFLVRFVYFFIFICYYFVISYCYKDYLLQLFLEVYKKNSFSNFLVVLDYKDLFTAYFMIISLVISMFVFIHFILFLGHFLIPSLFFLEFLDFFLISLSFIFLLLFSFYLLVRYSGYLFIFFSFLFFSEQIIDLSIDLTLLSYCNFIFLLYVIKYSLLVLILSILVYYRFFKGFINIEVFYLRILFYTFGVFFIIFFIPPDFFLHMLIYLVYVLIIEFGIFVFYFIRYY